MSKPKLYVAFDESDGVVTDINSLPNCTNDAKDLIDCEEYDELTVYQLVPIRKLVRVNDPIKIIELKKTS